MPSLDLSLIIPCYNEEKILRQSLSDVFEVLDKSSLKYEVIFVDDFSQDNTVGVIKQLIKENSRKEISIILHNKNEGRGRAVSDGILHSKGRITGFIDIDLSTPASCIPELISEIDRGADIATALRRYKLTISVLPRFLISKTYQLLLRLLLGLELYDTETGCKFFNRDKILTIIDDIRDTHWFWDTEVMVRGYIKGLKISEVPSIFVRKGLYSRVRIFRDSIAHLVNLMELHKELKNKHLI